MLGMIGSNDGSMAVIGQGKFKATHGQLLAKNIANRKIVEKMRKMVVENRFGL